MIWLPAPLLDSDPERSYTLSMYTARLVGMVAFGQGPSGGTATVERYIPALPFVPSVGHVFRWPEHGTYVATMGGGLSPVMFEVMRVAWISGPSFFDCLVKWEPETFLTETKARAAWAKYGFQPASVGWPHYAP